MTENPFPGMNPWLEYFWGDVHTRLTVCACDELQSRLPPKLVARIDEYEAAKVGRDEPATLRSIRIMDIAAGHRIVTSIEFVHLASKESEDGREQFRSRQAMMHVAGVNLVEIDLLRTGTSVLSLPTEEIPEQQSEPYRICIVRGNRQEVAEVYRVSLQEPLPTIRIPLREDDADVCLQLQPLIDTAYIKGRYYEDIDYREDPLPPLTGSDAEWVDQMLREQGL